MSDGMTTTVRTLADAEVEIASLKAALDDTQAECDEAWSEAARFEELAAETADAAEYVRTVDLFIADVRRGLRDLSEYEDVCGG